MEGGVGVRRWMWVWEVSVSVMSKGVMWEMGAGYGVCEDRRCGKGGCEKEGLFTYPH